MVNRGIQFIPRPFSSRLFTADPIPGKIRRVRRTPLASQKVYQSPEAALADVSDGAVVCVGGFGGRGAPESLLQALRQRGVSDLTLIYSPGAWPGGAGSPGVTDLVANGQIRKLISSLPYQPGTGGPIEEGCRSGKLQVEVVPQGTLAERLRAGGAGLGAVFLPTGLGTRFAQGKEVRLIDRQECQLETPLRADLALLRAVTADQLGNLVYRGTQRNWGPVMAMAANLVVVEVDHICPPGGLDPEAVITPGIFVNRIVEVTGA